ncbi:MAG: glycosyltransferase family 2 protein [Kineosporiaceae bacterium]|nr:glycosyltransferase family 2 protein [Aeromicrobium sp.]
MTLMVRDEADVIASQIEHHIAQGIDLFIVTDNGSVDGTTEILQGYETTGILVLHHDPVHQKQQGETVTKMAREAYSKCGADWVLNADADEFWVASNGSLTVREALSGTSKSLVCFPVPVVDMIGDPALVGSGLGRLVYRDLRSVSKLRDIGLHAHATPDTPHIGSPDVVVAQGNHFVNLTSTGAPPSHLALEVLHFPWRSWEQFRRKVDNAGRAYENQTGLTPSPNHHGMRDYRRLRAGTLLAHYMLRHPTEDQLRDGVASGEFVHELRIAGENLTVVADVPLLGEKGGAASASMSVLNSLELALRDSSAMNVALEDGATAQAQKSEDEVRELRFELAGLRSEVVELEAVVSQERAVRAQVQDLLAAQRNRRIVRVVDAVADRFRKTRRQ